MRYSFWLLAALCATGAQAIGLQHATFRSQSTQGPTWLGTADITKENYRITVYPDYLDVELEWEFTVGGTRPEQYGDALEIVGNLNLAENSSVIGMLVWYKDKILKAKLKSGETARNEYEQVVDRNSTVPPRPRDPVLLEWIRQDNYDISIFPVAWGSSRKIRFRYLVPVQGGKVVYPYAFSSHSTATLLAGPGTKGFQMTFSDATKQVVDSRADFSASEYDLEAWASGGVPHPASISPILAQNVSSSFFMLGSFAGISFAGQMAHAYLIPPPAIQDRLAGTLNSNWSLTAVVRSGQDSCSIAYPVSGGSMPPFADIRVYGKQPIQRSIAWRLSKPGEADLDVDETPLVIDAGDGMQFARAAGTGPFYPLAPAMPASLGAALGLIDSKYALVALEEDAVSASLMDRYSLQGVPTLDTSDVKLAPGEDFSVPVDQWIAQRNQTRASLATPYYVQPKSVFTSLSPRNSLPEGVRLDVRGNRLMLELPPGMLRDTRNLRVAVCDVRGTILKTWSGAECQSGLLSWSPSEAGRASGVYLLRMWTAGGAYSVRFVIP
ncbi:MAG: hypothetical protein JF616_01050 [Fibrobacteres bacterium]|nr:hypothetical protein [Fibrobacterota bacterium]